MRAKQIKSVERKLVGQETACVVKLISVYPLPVSKEDEGGEGMVVMGEVSCFTMIGLLSRCSHLKKDLLHKDSHICCRVSEIAR